MEQPYITIPPVVSSGRCRFSFSFVITQFVANAAWIWGGPPLTPPFLTWDSRNRATSRTGFTVYGSFFRLFCEPPVFGLFFIRRVIAFTSVGVFYPCPCTSCTLASHIIDRLSSKHAAPRYLSSSFGFGQPWSLFLATLQTDPTPSIPRPPSFTSKMYGLSMSARGRSARDAVFVSQPAPTWSCPRYTGLQVLSALVLLSSCS